MADHYHRPRDDNRTRSRSPRRHKPHSHRDRSPHRHHKHHRGDSSPTTDSKPTKQSNSTPILLPFNSRPLTKRDFETFKPMFALYLDIQKGKVLEDLDEIEVKGRWKSFLGKWNRGELSEGWYDPSTLRKAVESAVEVEAEGSYEKQRERDVERPVERREVRKEEAKREEEYSESDDEVGPALPGQQSRRRNRFGPSIPNMQDLELKKEMDAEDGLARRDDIRYERKLDRRDQKEKLDELVPRAEAGTRERQLEKKKELNEKMKGFREKDDGVAEVKDEDLMGGGDGIGDYKKQKEQFERKKNERELRKEEILRARMAEREERLMEYKVKEDATMAMLKALAKQNFG